MRELSNQQPTQSMATGMSIGGGPGQLFPGQNSLAY